MKAMILAAGRGERLKPLTDHTPKPLIRVAGKPIIQYTIEALVAAGLDDIVINLAYLGGEIEQALGDGSQFGALIQYSHEGETALETAGGIIHALPMLGENPFLVVNGDIITDYAFSRLASMDVSLAHLVMVPNPPHHPTGDFSVQAGRVCANSGPRYTFSGIGVYRSQLFAGCGPGVRRLAPLLTEAMKRDAVSGEIHNGLWMDMGTRERLQEAETRLSFAPSRGSGDPAG